MSPELCGQAAASPPRFRFRWFVLGLGLLVSQFAQRSSQDGPQLERSGPEAGERGQGGQAQRAAEVVKAGNGTPAEIAVVKAANALNSKGGRGAESVRAKRMANLAEQKAAWVASGSPIGSALEVAGAKARAWRGGGEARRGERVTG